MSQPPAQLIVDLDPSAPIEVRVGRYNEAIRQLAALVEDVVDAPCLAVRLLPVDLVQANDYNPNNVAPPEMDLLEQSIRCDGVTMPVVVHPEEDGTWTVVDGFHRRRVLSERLGATYLPCSTLDRSRGERIASTVRHNRARGKHQVDRMGDLVRELVQAGRTDEHIAEHLGLTVEEALRLKQLVGIAHIMASPAYGRAWEQPGGPNLPHE
jgi:ParB-like chromosome segregation protein Spo0J